MSKKKKILELKDKGWNAEQIAHELGLKASYVNRVLNESKPKEITLEDIKLNIPQSTTEQTIKVEPEPIKIEPYSTEQQKSEFIDLSGIEPSSTEVSEAQQENIEKLRKSISKNITTFEKALFKALTEKELPSDEEQMLYTSWKTIIDITVKDTNQQLTIAVILLIMAHGGIIILHKDDLINGLKRMKQKTEQQNINTEFSVVNNVELRKKPPVLKSE